MNADNQVMPNRCLVYGVKSTITVGSLGAGRQIDLDESGVTADTIDLFRGEGRNLARHDDRCP